MKKLIYTWCLLSFTFSCGVEEFSAKKQRNTTTTSTIQTNSFSACAASTAVRPKVDLLFIWDNSTSSSFLSPSTKAALNNTINKISERFDYHVLMAPLLGSGNNSSLFFSYSGHIPGSGISVIDKSNASVSLSSFPTVSGNAESGAKRARDLLRTNISNGVFRNGAYHIVVIMSNDDDNSFQTGNFLVSADPYIQNRAHDLLCVRGNSNSVKPSGYTGGPYNYNCSGSGMLNSAGMRFISIIAEDSNKCSSLYTINKVYKGLSTKVYAAPYTNGTANPTDQNGELDRFNKSSSDVYDICDNPGSNVFDGINEAVKETILKHVYRYWPVTGSSNTVDPTTIQVTMSNGQALSPLSNSLAISRDLSGKNDTAGGVQVTGWRFITGNVSALNTRFLPDAGEPYSGKVIELFGNAKVTFPLCLKVTSNASKDYYGYVHLASKPVKSSIALRINGVVISQSSSNGWQLIESGGQPQYFSNKNMKIISPTNFNEAFPAVRKTGYFLKLYGSAVYSNNAVIDPQYSPAGN